MGIQLNACDFMHLILRTLTVLFATSMRSCREHVHARRTVVWGLHNQEAARVGAVVRLQLMLWQEQELIR